MCRDMASKFGTYSQSSWLLDCGCCVLLRLLEVSQETEVTDSRCDAAIRGMQYV